MRAAILLVIATLLGCTQEPAPEALRELTSRVSSLEQELEREHDTVAALEAELVETRAGAQNLAAELERASAGIGELERQLASEIDRRRDVESEIEELTRQVCPYTDAKMPESTAASLADSLISDLRRSGQMGESEPPPELSPTIETFAGDGGTWLFVASFDSVFEPGVFFTDDDGAYVVVWSGVAGSTFAIWDHIFATAPEVPDQLVRCLDVSRFLAP